MSFADVHLQLFRFPRFRSLIINLNSRRTQKPKRAVSRSEDWDNEPQKGGGIRSVSFGEISSFCVILPSSMIVRPHNKRRKFGILSSCPASCPPDQQNHLKDIQQFGDQERIGERLLLDSIRCLYPTTSQIRGWKTKILLWSYLSNTKIWAKTLLQDYLGHQ